MLIISTDTLMKYFDTDKLCHKDALSPEQGALAILRALQVGLLAESTKEEVLIENQDRDIRIPSSYRLAAYDNVNETVEVMIETLMTKHVEHKKLNETQCIHCDQLLPLSDVKLGIKICHSCHRKLIADDFTSSKS